MQRGRRWGCGSLAVLRRGSGPQLTISGPPLLYASIDPNRCEDTTGTPLEGRSVEPDLVVEYDPVDLAAGVDTVMEAAVAALLAD